MSEGIEDKIQYIFDWEAYYRKNKELRELDIFISEHLFENPCVAWSWIDYNDGVDVIYPNETWKDERQKEPLYLLSGEDFHEDYRNFESFFKSNEEYSDGSKKDPQYIKERWEEESVNGIHRRNLKKIPEYSRDLNLIRRCEEKLKEMELINDYVVNLLGMSGVEDQIFPAIMASAELKARAIVETLKKV